MGKIPLLLPLLRDYLEKSGYKMNEKITLRYLSTANTHCKIWVPL